MSDAFPYSLFDVTLARRTPLSPALARLTFAGEDVKAMATHAPDQRIKIFFPDAEGRPAALPKRPDWLAIYKAQDAATRSPMRTYTIRALRADAGEVDIDFVLHGDAGPASAWAETASVGDAVQIVAPNRDFEGDGGGFEWRPPEGLGQLLLMADETALPAVAGILDELAASASPPRAQVFIEVPSEGDRIGLPSWPGLRLDWLVRGQGDDHPTPGALLVAAAHEALAHVVPSGAVQALEDVDVDSQILWERADPRSSDFYAWIAGEAGAVREIRRLMIKEKGVDRGAVTLMGYWRIGQVLD